MAKVSDIKYFSEACAREENDKVNRIREDCILVLNHDEHPFFQDRIYGSSWKILKDQFTEHVKAILKEKKIDQKLVTYALLKKAHLNNHHDFDLLLLFEDEYITYNWEFKFNSMPQFVSLYDKERFLPIPLAEYWYDEKIIDQILALYPSQLTKPTREHYLEEVMKPVGKKTKDAFFKQLYLWDDEGDYSEGSPIYCKKLELVHKAIQRYLEQNYTSFDLPKFRSRIDATQQEKIYGIWKPKKKAFEMLEYSKEMLTPVKIDKIVNGNSILLDTQDPTAQIKCYLRWRNHQGVSNPAWQISLQRRAIPSVVQKQKLPHSQ